MLSRAWCPVFFQLVALKLVQGSDQVMPCTAQNCAAQKLLCSAHTVQDILPLWRVLGASSSQPKRHFWLDH